MVSKAIVVEAGRTVVVAPLNRFPQPSRIGIQRMLKGDAVILFLAVVTGSRLAVDAVADV